MLKQIKKNYKKSGILAIKKSSFTSYETDEVSKDILSTKVL